MSTPKRSVWHKLSIALGIVVLLSIVLGLVVLTLVLHEDWYNPSREVTAHWPTRLDQNVENHVPMQVKSTYAGMSVELGYLREPVDPRAVETNHPDPSVDARDKRVAALALEYDGYEVLSESETDEDGGVSLVIPPVNTFHTGSKDPTLIVKVRHAYKGWVGYVTLPTSSASDSRILLSTDRPLYQSGQQIQMRALVLEGSTGSPIEAARAERGAAVEFTVHGPRDNLLSRERALVSPAGVASHSFALSSDGQQGTYKLSVDYDGKTTTKLVDVKPYEKPRFDVELTTAPQATEGIAAGGRLRGTVRAEYFYGEPVTSAPVTIKVRPDGPSSDQVDALATATGTLDATGRFDFAIDLPNDLAPALLTGQLLLSARVTDSSGRVHRAEQTVQPQEDRFQVEVVPVDATRFRIGQTNQTKIVVRDRNGEPVSDLDIEVGTNGDHDQRTPVTARTDERGTAVVSWLPSTPPDVKPSTFTKSTDLLDLRGDVEVELKPDDSKRILKKVRVALALPDAIIITPQTAAPAAGDELAVELQLPEGERPRLRLGDSMTTLVAVHEGVSIATARVRHPRPASSETTATGTITLGAGAQGLTHLITLDRWGRPNGIAAVWVRQDGGSEVQLTPNDAPFRPGEPASVEMSFPPGNQTSSSTGEAPVTFGVWAVDEALYALKERTDLPFAMLARQNANTVEALIPILERIDAGDEHAAISAAHLTREANYVQDSPASLRSLNGPFEQHAKQYWISGWLVTMVLIGFAFLTFETRRAWQHMSPGGLSSTLIATFFCTCIAVIGAALVFDSASFESREAVRSMENGLLALIALVVLVGIGDALIFARDLQLWRWLVALGVCIGIAVSMGTVIDAPESLPAQVGIRLGALLALGMVLSQLGMWSVALWGRSRRMATVAMLTLIALAFGVLLATAFDIWPEPEYPKPHEHGVDAFVRFGGPPSAGSEEASTKRKRADLRADARADERAARERARTTQDETGNSAQSAKSAESANSVESTSTQPALRVRDYFPDTMFWYPELPSDADGRATVDLELPDSITAWRVHAVAHTSDGRFGEGQAGLEVTQPFFVELDLPTQLTAGDQIKLPVTLVDARQKAEGTSRVELSAETDGGLHVDGSIGAVELEPGERRVVWLSIDARTVGEASLEVRAHLEGGGGAAKSSEGDAVRRKTRIVADGRERASTYSATIGDGFQALLTLPSDTIEGTASSRVDILSGPSAAALDGLDAMLSQPHGCFEQTTAIAFPNIMVLRSLDQTTPSAWPDGAEAHQEARKRAFEFVSQSYQRILTFQDESGGFGAYPGKSPNIMLTAYGLLQLAEIQSALDVDASPSMRAAAGWLRRQQRDDGTWDLRRRAASPRNRVKSARVTAHVIWALSRLSESQDNVSAVINGTYALKELLGEDGIGDYERALAANALLAAGRRTDAENIIEQLAKSAQRSGDAHFWNTGDTTWTGGRKIYADITTTALAARAIARTGVHAALTDGAMDFLAAARQPGGGWGTTEATVWALDALASAPKGTRTPVRLSVRVNGHDTGKLRMIPERGVPHTFRPEVVGYEQRFEIDSDRATNAVAQATIGYSVPWDSPAARVKDEPFAIDLRLGSRTLKAGEPTGVEVTIANRSGNDSAATIVKLPIPPGAFVDDAMLDSLAEQQTVDRIERTPTHLSVYLAQLRAGAKITLAYAIIPRMGGTYTLPPAIAYPYYNPNPTAQIAGGELRVRR